MAQIHLIRIKKEYGEVSKCKSAGVSAELVDKKWTHWKGKIEGPAETPYEGGIFVVDIKIPSNYPFEPPKMRFETKVWHPNVSSANGAICLDILKTEWSPALTMRTALLSLQALLSCPNPDDPQDAQVAKQYKKNKKKFDQTARFWTDTYATPKKKLNIEAAIKNLCSMGFGQKQVVEALEKYNGDENKALDSLLC